MDKQFPVYKLKISDDDNNPLIVDYIGLVDDPAIQMNWLQFEKKIKFAPDPERRLIMGALMIADMPIYRRDEKIGEHYVVFDKEEIYKIVQKFFRNKLTSNFNIMHSEANQVDDIYLIESIIVDESRGVKAPEAFKDISQGSWIATVKVDNDYVWQEFIKTGQLKAFSIEGLFAYEKVGDNSEKILDEIIEIVKHG